MPMLKTVSARQGRTCEEIRAYLECGRRTDEIRARDIYLQNLSSKEWGRMMDIDRDLFAQAKGTHTGRKATRPYYHFILSPSDEDHVSVSDCMSYARDWLHENFPVDDFQAAIVIHDDNRRRIADGGEGITHAHIIINPTCISNGHRVHIDRGASRRKKIEAGETGPEFIHEDMLADSAQRLAEERGWSAFDNEDRSYKKSHRARTFLAQSEESLYRDLECKLPPVLTSELNDAFIGAGIEAKLSSKEGGYSIRIPAQYLQHAQTALDSFIDARDEKARQEALKGRRTLTVARVRGDENADFLQGMLEEAQVDFDVSQQRAHLEFSFSADQSQAFRSVVDRLVKSKALDPLRIFGADDAFASIVVADSLKGSFPNYDSVFSDLVADNPEDNLTSTEVSLRSRGAYCWKDSIRSRIESAAKRSQSMDEFKYRMNQAHIRVEYWSGGLLYKDENGHVVRDAILGAGYTSDAVAARFLKVSWIEEARRIEKEAEEEKERMVQETIYCYRMMTVDDARHKDIRRELKIISELDLFLTEEKIRSRGELNEREAQLEKMGTDLKVELRILGARLDCTRPFVDACEKLDCYRMFAEAYEGQRAVDPQGAASYYQTYFPEIDEYNRTLQSIQDDFGIDPGDIDEAIAEANEINEQFVAKHAAMEGTARRLQDLRTAREQARWVHEEVVLRAEQERAMRGELTENEKAMLAATRSDNHVSKSFYKKDKAPVWTLNISREAYKKSAERNRAARANFRRMQPHKYAEVPSYMKLDEQYRRSRVEQLQRERFDKALRGQSTQKRTAEDRVKAQLKNSKGFFDKPVKATRSKHDSQTR